MAGPFLLDRVVETTTTTGTGAYTPAGAVTGYRAVSDALSNGDSAFLTVEAINPGTGAPNGGWEHGVYTRSGSTLVRTQVLASSNGGSAVNWGGGTKRIFGSALSQYLRPWTATGDILYLGSDGRPTRLAAGSDGAVLTLAGGVPSWAAASSAPFADGTALVKGSSDATKLARFEVDGFTTATTRVFTLPDQDGTVVVLERANTFTAGPQTLRTGDDANKGLVVRSNSNTQTANLLEAQNHDGTIPVTEWKPFGRIVVDQRSALGPDNDLASTSTLIHLKQNGVTRWAVFGSGLSYWTQNLDLVNGTPPIGMVYGNSKIQIHDGSGTIRLSAAGGDGIRLEGGNAGVPIVTINATSGMTEDLFRTRDSSGNKLTYIGADGRLYFKAPTTAPTDANLVNNSATMWLDEATGDLIIRSRLSDGSYLTHVLPGVP